MQLRISEQAYLSILLSVLQVNVNRRLGTRFFYTDILHGSILFVAETFPQLASNLYFITAFFTFWMVSVKQ